jgi:acylphosphatase
MQRNGNGQKRVHVFYAGRVQGVGFRMTAEEAAGRCGVVGWVKNLRDGRVELVVEGEEEVLERFLIELRQGPMKNFIAREECVWGPASNALKSFEILYF